MDLFDEDFAEVLPVSGFFLKAFAAFFLEYHHFIASHVVQDFGRDPGIFDQGLTNGDFSIVVEQQYLGEFKGGSGFTFKPVDEDFAVFFYFELLSGYFYNCIHGINIIKRRSINLGVQRYKFFQNPSGWD